MQRTWFSPMWFGDLDDDVDGHFSELAVVHDADGVVNGRQMSLGELDVEAGPMIWIDFADAAAVVSVAVAMLFSDVGCWLQVCLRRVAAEQQPSLSYV